MTNSSTCDRAISAVLPLRIRGGRDDRELGRARNLFRSLARFAEPGLFADIHVVLPTDDVETATGMDWAVDLPLRFVDQNDLLPELAGYGSVGGWTTQQMIKLAATRVVTTDFYLTLDADVLCTSPIGTANLVPGGRALLQTGPRMSHKPWWTASAHILEVDPRLDEPGICVTPALLSSQACLGLQARLQTRSRSGSWIDVLLRPHRRLAWQRAVPWSKSRYRVRLTRRLREKTETGPRPPRGPSRVCHCAVAVRISCQPPHCKYQSPTADQPTRSLHP